MLLAGLPVGYAVSRVVVKPVAVVLELVVGSMVFEMVVLRVVFVGHLLLVAQLDWPVS